jgi:hypothetical protein
MSIMETASPPKAETKRISTRKNWLTSGEVAGLCEVAPRTAARWIDSGKLKGIRLPLSQDRRVEKVDLIDFARSHGMDRVVAALEGANVAALFVGFSDDDAGTLAGRIGPFGVRPVFAGSSVAAGIAIAESRPGIVVIDPSLGVVDAAILRRVVRGRPNGSEVRLIWIDRGVDAPAGFETVAPAALAATILAGKGVSR